MTISCVLDAYALLAWLRREPGADVVDPLLPESAVSAANWSEVLQKVAQRGRDMREVGMLLQSLGVEIVPVTAVDAEAAAAIWIRAPSLSLGDRCCIALARRLQVPAVTADRDWLAVAQDVQVRTIR